MTSYRQGEPSGFISTRLEADRTMLGSRTAVARYANRSVITVRRYCVPTACDVATRGDLYDLDSAVRQLTVMEIRTCFVPDDEGERCGSTVIARAPYPVCAMHAAVISEFFLKQDPLALVRHTAQVRQGNEAGLKLPKAKVSRPRTSVVYYVQVDARIKIGTTVDIEGRMMTYPPYARLLATEPGGYLLEAKRLRQFNEYLFAGKEWFDPGPRLRAHIEKLMASSAVA